MERRRRTARPALLLACAVAVPAMLLAGCSSGGGSGSDDSASSAAATPTTPAIAPAKYGTLPGGCATLGKTTVAALVPKVKASGGTPAQSEDAKARAGCSWTGNGSDGYQYRWLSVTLQRFSSTPTESAEQQAKDRFTDQVGQLGKAPGASTSAVAKIGDQASSTTVKATVAKVTSQNSTLVTRVGNVVVIVEYNGAGLEGKKNPSATTVRAGAERAAKDAVLAVVGANG
ncbi:DUF3558 domain-containing protein [Streptomyces cocklensis]|uniref:DUF3558 domain-containing protein n=1 Tax=Actinacidiphila cocklensis TaxID=887465 RepID=A0A9W4GVT1_9ACTN|nr:DUF3558 domain-containing protein [Actinacidiphila cocklensis]MDD1061166.1 DUF3558 domain-containing protein [Actinacidiphila cocklensis]WSX77482.1 DUF3558 domain-containing protein [Streptomyces sp. NBC_00899]CAG6398248.1 conserved exported hypothetical protein [Actinacidiphila cocklensis]